MKQLLVDAESEGIFLEPNMAKIEDAALLNQMGRMRLDMKPSSAAAGKGPMRTGALKSLKEDHNELNRNNAQLQQRFDAMQKQMTDVLRDKSALGAENEALRASLGDAGAAQSKSSVASGQAGERSAKQVAALEARLSAAEGETSMRVNESRQFLQMKKIMGQKTEQCRILRERLSKYESDDIDEDAS